MATTPGPLGCAQEYGAKLTWQETGGDYGPSLLDDATAITWSRTLNDTSDATVTVSKRGLSPECCEELGSAKPWLHELNILRDGQLLWQGPLVRKRENRNSIIFEARDVLAYLDRLINTYTIRYVTAEPDARGRMRDYVTNIAYNHILLNVTESTIRVPDYCRIMDYFVLRENGPKISWEKDGSSNTAIWAKYVGDLLRELLKRGLAFTTVGRSIVLIGGEFDADTPAIARLNIVEDFTDDVEIIDDGNAFATYAVATNQDQQNISEGYRAGTGTVGTPYGAIELLVSVNDENPDEPSSVTDLREVARQSLAGRYPVPTAISMPANSTLTPTAPVNITDLVPGARVDVSTEGACTNLLQSYRLTDVQGSWSASSDGGGEKVQIGLTPLNVLADVEGVGIDTSVMPTRFRPHVEGTPG